MSWCRVSVIVAGRDVEALSEALMDAGALAVDVSDADAGTDAEQAAYGEPGGRTEPWRRSCLSALFAADVDARSLTVGACHRAALPNPDAMTLDEVGDQDWVRLTQSQFKPIRISPQLWIVPTWESPPDPAAINLVLDPGAAFGTGSHPTTRLCLQWLVANIRGGESVLDYGCGSGILAIAARRLGASRAIGVDIDPQAVLAARANAMQNRVAAEFHEPGGASEPRCDVVLANILANPLITLAPLLAKATLAGGQVVLSGVLAAQADAVVHTYSAWYEMADPALDEGWALITGRRFG